MLPHKMPLHNIKQGFPTRGTPRCIMRPAATFVN